jgi:5-formyltetrahydrofolate cyclo-ligase
MKIANQLITLPVWKHTYYHLFLSIEEQKEVQTEYILHILHAKDKEVVISKSNFNTYEMTHFLLTDNTKIKKNRYNIPEPIDGIEVPSTKLNVVFIPLLAFDNRGNRVGYGKGFYDRMLKKCTPNTIKIGLSFFETSENIDDISDNDIKLDYCITPEKVYTF